MIVLVTGGRYYNDAAKVNSALGSLFGVIGGDELIILQGGAKGADFMAKAWAERNTVHCATVPAMWGTEYGRGAGVVRNKAMLLLKPDLCVAFPGGVGTDDMVRRCLEAGVEVMDCGWSSS